MKKIAIYPGTFDPITYGHLDVINTGSKIFDKIIVAILKNPIKTPMFSEGQRLSMIRAALTELNITNAEAISSNGLSVDLASKQDAIAIIRGLRLTADYENELNIALNNKVLNHMISTIFIPPEQNHIHISSSTVRQLIGFDSTERLHQYLPRSVITIIAKK